MSGRLEVREAVSQFFAQAGLSYVGQVFPARPEVLTEQAYETNRFGEAVASGNGSSAVLVVNLPQDDRQRRADTGRGAVNDQWTYKVALEVWFASTLGEAVRAQEDYDAVIDGIENLIRSNATLASDAIWSAGEYEAGISHTQGMPFTDSDGMTVMIHGVVRFDAMQWVAGPV
jgi:hypothetical protein